MLLGNSFVKSSKKFSNNFQNRVFGYGAHAYVVFQNAYDKYIRYLDKFKMADCFWNDGNDIMGKDKFFMT